jgi:transposase
MDLTDAQWAIIEPLIPKPRRRKYQTCHRRFQRSHMGTGKR